MSHWSSIELVEVCQYLVGKKEEEKPSCRTNGSESCDKEKSVDEEDGASSMRHTYWLSAETKVESTRSLLTSKKPTRR